MQTNEHLEALRREGELLAAAATRGGPDSLVPPCPGWVVRDLVHHIGATHRWAQAIVAGRFDRRPTREEREQAIGPLPSDDCLVAWFREGHARLLDTLRTAPADLECWQLFGTLSPAAFWARRQAHETAIHRVDAEAATGEGLSPVPAGFALDGIDELLAGFHTRERSRLRSDEPRLLRVRATGAEGDADWYVYLSDEPARVKRESADTPDCVLSGAAGDLYLALWNRATADLLTVEGDASLLRLWQERSAV